jgi:hypothetical protein
MMRKLMLAAMSLVLMVTPVVAAPGDTLRVGTLEHPATFVDANTGTAYAVFIEAHEGPFAAGRGNVTVSLSEQGPRPRLSLCTVNGPAALVTPPTSESAPYGGNNPLQDTRCGTAGAQAVSLDRCVARIEAHGYVHSDNPNTVYLGSTTVDIRYEKNARRDTIQMTLHTPKDKIKLVGDVTASFFEMSSCQ